ncbi:MAG: hypothetical protein CMQ34_06370 [Gammaproteobacteria bacterium]|nr:hypothetical protein [Gammaproteobacteria bacterium]|tara:strand:+ start:3657 stop:5291 length:1635 start_codon:yes stop_codon:yes gene_type:complete
MRRAGRHFHSTGLLVGTFFFAMSLTPSLLPREGVVQGAISGLSLAAGYGVGVTALLIWSYFHLPTPRARIQWFLQVAAGSVCALFAIVFLWRASTWQNQLRDLMGMEEITGVQVVSIGLVALLVFLATLVLARLFRHTFLFLSGQLRRFVPRRVSIVAGLMAALFVFWSVIDGVFFTMALRTADRSYQQIDALIEPETAQPADPWRTGSAESLLSWESMGRHGRRFISLTPTAEAISAFTTAPTMPPIRVYAGLNAAQSADERAALALTELLRVKAFDRSVMILITPTGTGWIDPAGISTVEYLHRGDVASVAAQYSYLSSPLALMSEDEYGVDMARSLFQAVYGHWRTLPSEQRPKLYLHGLSLGARNSDLSFDFYDIIEDPFDGVLWSGPPFRSGTWQNITERRNPDSPAWLPRFRDGSVVRFANQNGGMEQGDARWGSFRIGYLQYASDPVTFFAPESFYREPEWMSGPRGPDVSRDMRWFPIVTMLQLAADMGAGSAPDGFGHQYAAQHYHDAWLALTEPAGWQPEELRQLRAWLQMRRD